MPGTSNFLQWNPTQANQEADSAYAADAVRSGGAAIDGIFPSATANKLFYQLSTMVAALGQMLANKGYAVSDGNFNDLVAILANILTNADQRPNMVTVNYGNAVTFDNSLSNGFYLQLQGNVVGTGLINIAAGNRLLFSIQQNSIGGYTFAWPPNVINPGMVDPAPNATSIQEFVVHPDNTVHPIGPMVVS